MIESLTLAYISRIEERAKETSKTTKFLYKMLSNKILITPPKDPVTLTGWREKLERDVEQIKSETNQVNLRKALERSSIIMKEERGAREGRKRNDV